jgi:hypothetical protein
VNGPHPHKGHPLLHGRPGPGAFRRAPGPEGLPPPAHQARDQPPRPVRGVVDATIKSSGSASPRPPRKRPRSEQSAAAQGRNPSCESASFSPSPSGWLPFRCPQPGLSRHPFLSAPAPKRPTRPPAPKPVLGVGAVVRGWPALPCRVGGMSPPGSTGKSMV